MRGNSSSSTTLSSKSAAHRAFAQFNQNSTSSKQHRLAVRAILGADQDFDETNTTRHNLRPPSVSDSVLDDVSPKCDLPTYMITRLRRTKVTDVRLHTIDIAVALVKKILCKISPKLLLLGFTNV
jgi:hypothetical protein